jgi:hypothetical protein
MVRKNLGSSAKRIIHHKNLFKEKFNYSSMNKWLELFLGLVLLIVVILVTWASSTYSWVLFGKDFDFLHAGWIFLKGVAFWFVTMIALLLIVLGINDLRE